jgi:hypothetical protein
MARRIDIELTSKREDDTWTWRAAGAREPKGSVDGKLLPTETKVGDVLKVEVEGFLDGLSIVAVIPNKSTRREPERIELLAPRSEGTLVTTQLAKRRRDDDRRDRRRRDDRGDRDRGERGDRRGPRADRGDRDRDRERGDRDRRRERPSTPPPEPKPKPKRLRPARAHRAALLESLPAEQRPIAEQLLQGGIPAVRQAIEKQNEALKAEGKSQVAAEPLLEIAEKLRNKAQAAVWRDRADAALASVDDLDLRDLRSVVNAADDAGRDQEARGVADQLREALANRVEKEQSAWVAEVAENLQEGRVVRALRLSSRPPKAGSPLPGNLAEQLITATNAALTAETGPQRWATVLDALAYSPIRRRVVPDSLPEKLPADLREVIAKLGSRLPEIAHIFAIEPSEAAGRPRPARRKGGKPEGGGSGGGRGERGERKGGRGKGEGRKPEAKAAPEPSDEAAPTEAPDAEVKPTDAEATTEAPAPAATDADGAGTEAATEAEATAPETTEAAAEGTGTPAPDTEAAAAPAAVADDAEPTEVPATAAEEQAPQGAEAAAEANGTEVVEAGGEPTEAQVEEATVAADAPEAAPEAPAAGGDTVEAGGEPTEALVEEATEAASGDEDDVEATAPA